MDEPLGVTACPSNRVSLPLSRNAGRQKSKMSQDFEVHAGRQWLAVVGAVDACQWPKAHGQNWTFPDFFFAESTYLRALLAWVSSRRQS